MAFFFFLVINIKIIILVLLAICGVVNSNAESFSKGLLFSWHGSGRCGSLGILHDMSSAFPLEGMLAVPGHSWGGGAAGEGRGCSAGLRAVSGVFGKLWCALNVARLS